MIHVHTYEKWWIAFTIIMLVAFAAAITVSAFVSGIQLPVPEARVDPKTIAQTPPFDNPGLRELAPGKYEAYIRAATWQFTPGEIHVPVGSTVTFYATSIDVQHGFRIMETNINMMVLPGQISTLTAHFEKPGTYDLICTEYCGAGGPTIGHHTMYGQIFVDEKKSE